jgi:protein-disulfide isomerase
MILGRILMKLSYFFTIIVAISLLTACDNNKVEQVTSSAQKPDTTAAVETTPSTQVVESKTEVKQYLWSERSLGSINAPITIIEYASLGCGHCAHFHATTLPVIKQKYIDTGKVRFIFRDFPLENLSFQASQLTRCLPESSYFGAIALLFEKQSDWHNASGDITTLRQLLALAGLDAAVADACLASEPLKVKLLEVRLDAGNNLKVESTPTFFVGDTKISGDVGVEALSAALDKALASVPVAPAE